MEEPHADQSKEKPEVPGEGKKWTEVHPYKPLTHTLNRAALQAAYREVGLVRPELERQKPARSGDKSHGRPQPHSAVQKPKETESMAATTVTSEESPKPGVGGTTHKVKVQSEEISYGQRCLWNGGTATVTGAVLMLTWKGLTRWLG